MLQGPSNCPTHKEVQYIQCLPIHMATNHVASTFWKHDIKVNKIKANSTFVTTLPRIVCSRQATFRNSYHLFNVVKFPLIMYTTEVSFFFLQVNMCCAQSIDIPLLTGMPWLAVGGYTNRSGNNIVNQPRSCSTPSQ